jgi:nucleoside-diphosphate-sugar epimerase
VAKEFKMTKGEQTREFNYIDDIVDGFVRVAESDNIIGEIINIGNAWEYQIKDVAQKIVMLMGDPIKVVFGAFPYRQGEAMRFFSSNEKARQLLGWVPKTDLETGLKNTIKWYQDNATYAQK